MLEKFLKGTYSFERQLGKNIVFSKDEIAIIHKRKAFWEKLVHIENLINLPYFSQINQSELNMLLGEKGFEAKENDDLKEWEAMDQAIRNKKYGSVDLPKFKWINPTTQKAEDDTLLASGEISHLLSGENDQSQADRNNQCISFSFL